jgi:ABC-type transport system involved in multi-copper enzyme maturation permease subunit
MRSDVPLGEIGQNFWMVTFWMQLGLVTLITPGLTSGLLVAEREQQTLDTILLTGLKPTDIVVGKLLSIALFIIWLLVGSLPVTSIVFLTGGVAPSEILLAYVLLTFSAMVYGCIGIACSSVARSQGKATLLAYTAAIALFIGTCVPAVPAIMHTVDGQTAYFSAINALGSPGANSFKEIYFGISFPTWLISGIINTSLTAIFTLLAAHHLSGCQPRYVVLLRRNVLGMLVAFAALLGSATQLSIGYIQVFVFLAPIALVATFGTGAAANNTAAGSIWKRVFNGSDVASGRLFALITYTMAAITIFTLNLIFQRWMPVDNLPFTRRALGQLLVSGFMNTAALTGVAALSMRFLKERWGALGFTLLGWATPMFILGICTAFLPSSSSEAIGFIAQTTVFDYSQSPNTSHWISTAVAGAACWIVARWKR